MYRREHGDRGHFCARLTLVCASAVLAIAGPAFAASITRGPYLQSGTADSVVVRWRTDSATNGRVHYGPAPGNLSFSVDASGSSTEHAVTVGGLAPDTRYYYSVGTFTEILAGDDANHYFDTAPLPGSSSPMRIWVLGDSGTANVNAIAVRDAYYGHSGPLETDFWLMLGDNAYTSGTDAEYQTALFDIYPTMLRNAVLWPTLGNHDANSSSSSTQSGPYFEIFSLPTAGEAGGVPSGTEAYYSFDYANVHFVVLDSQDSDRFSGGPMITWLDADLAATDQEWVIAYWHHPPYSKGGHDSDDSIEEPRLSQMRENALPVLESHGVDLVLTGHSHSYERSFLIDGHYGLSGTFGPQHVKDGGDGREGGSGAYVKPGVAGVDHAGAVYAVAGSSGQISGGPLNHPAMFVSFNLLGSVVLEVDGGRLDARFLDSTAVVRDNFTIVKDADIVVDFTATPLGGGAALEVSFTDLSVNDPTEWAWDFEDDGTVDSTERNPTQIYDQPGSYSVRLTASGPNGTFEELKTDYIDVTLVAPDVDFSATPTSGVAPAAVAFTDLSQHLPDQWMWDFDNDGVVDSTEQNPVHVYATPGLYTVRLAASNAAGSQFQIKFGYIRVIANVPDEILNLNLLADDSTIVWDAHPNACGYDLLKGDIVQLVQGGSLSGSQLSCVVEDVVQPQAFDGQVPVLGQAFYYVVRGVDCAQQALTYDTSGLNQVHPRDHVLQGPDALCTCQASDDPDGDAYCAILDNCPDESNASQVDTDQDGVGDPCDNCPTTGNSDQLDFDLDGAGDACDGDDDDDGIPDLTDSCPLDPTNDIDADGICGLVDNCPDVANALQSDADADGFGDPCDCAAANPFCNSDCTDVDADDFCVTSDCDDTSSATFPGAAPNDSVSGCMRDVDDDDWGDDDPFEAVIAGTDCDDTSAAINPLTVWYADNDGDGFGDAASSLVVCAQPAGFVLDATDCNDLDPATFPGAAPHDDPGACMRDFDGDDWGDDTPSGGGVPGTDCDDDNALLHPQTVWYADDDMDGFGDPSNSQIACVQPAGHLFDAGDCDDTSALTFPGAAPNDGTGACMKDADGDDWGDDNPPLGVDPGTDCDDANAVVNPQTVWYADNDSDGFGDPGNSQTVCVEPAGHGLDDTDCDDSSATTFPGAAPEESADACMKDTDGDDWGDDTPPAGVDSGTDCDDADPIVNPQTVWYADTDSDGFGDPGRSQVVCLQPVGHLLDDDDCDDTSPVTFPGAAPNDGDDCMKDTDGDDWGDDNPPAGVDAGTDCDDADPVVNPQTVWYADLDSDGFGDAGNTKVICPQPADYLLDDTDCDDTSAVTFPGAAPSDSASACLKDTDGDDWGDDAPPAGVTPGTDCDDTDAVINPQTVWYADSDSDGFGDPGSALTICVQPAGHLLDETDCDDTSAVTFPGAAPNDGPTACLKDTDDDDWGDDDPPAGVDGGTDCDDADPIINPQTVWYADNDSDGFGDPGNSRIVCPQPAGHLLDDSDCDDGSAVTFPGAAPNDSAAACMKDTDADDWGDDSPPVGVDSGTDCDDADAIINPQTVWYADDDSDGFGDPGNSQIVCAQPAAHLLENTDCDDTSAVTFPGAAPNDSAAACMKDTDGDDWGDDGPPAGVDSGTDCDDADAVVNPQTVWYADTDSDGYGDPDSSQTICAQPAGHLLDDTDCDDTSAVTFPGAAPNDGASACMKDTDGDAWGDDNPPAGVDSGTDCDDSDSILNPQTIWYADTDADGFGDPDNSQIVCLQPAGHLLDNSDCDDTSAVTFPGAAPNDGAACLKDTDSDDWGDDSPPAGVDPGTDCDDADAIINPQTIWYADTDTDGFGDPGNTQTVCLQPTGHLLENTDCDDTSAVTFPGAAPNDGASTCMKDTDGDDWGDDNPPAGVDSGTDCDDTDAVINSQTVWYADTDADNFGDPGSSQIVCLQPAGHLLDDTDCDDTSAVTFPGAAPNDGASACMKDTDGDDWGDDSPPAGVDAGTDCDDTDAILNPQTVWHADTDTDGFGDPGNTQTVCLQPAGHLLDDTDCDDTSAVTFPGAAPNDSAVACMKDTDADDWGDHSPPAGVDSGADCDDTDAIINPQTVWYADTDADGFGDPGNSQVVCLQPASYLLDDTDCDDTSAVTFPGAAPNDSVSACAKDTDGDDWGDDEPPAGVVPGTDCDDVDAVINPQTVWYADTDADGFGDPGSSQTICAQPADHLLDDTDCDDTSAVTFPGAAPNDGASTCMKDTDGDDWGDDEPPAGVDAGTDCDDTDAILNPQTVWHADTDTDGFGDAGNTQTVCLQPAGHLLDDNDCDDTSAVTFPGAAPNDSAVACMKDTDADDWGDHSPPAGVDSGADCDDTDAIINPQTVWYADTDADGFGDPGNSQVVCLQPASHLLDDTDCDDTSAVTFPGAAPNDGASACMKDTDGDDWGDDEPPAGVVPGTDCDDVDAVINPQTVWYADTDADGFGDPGSSQTICAQPADHLLDDTDCDDTSAVTFPGAAPNDGASACMKDTDGDDWGDDEPPAGVDAGTDCDDTDAILNPQTVWHADTDTDGFGDAGNTQTVCLQPAGHLLDDTDCDDLSAVTFPGAAPNDSASACMKDTDGDDWGDDGPPAGVDSGTDCDDASAVTFPGAAPGDNVSACMKDADDDGWGDDAPAAGVASGTDCDDLSAVTFPGAAPSDNLSACMKDSDDDDYGDDSPPAGVASGTDCDDSNALIHPATIWYRDVDADGFGNPLQSVVSCTHPPRFVLDNTDCRDSGLGAAETYPGAAPNDSTTACLRDVDQDDWGDENPPTGVVAGTDCDDQRYTVHPLTVWYRDNDHDGFGDVSVSVVQCESPSGYVLVAFDCDDVSASATWTFPGAAPKDSSTECMKDVDGDDWGDEFPLLGVTPGTDCNDDDDDVHPPFGC